MPGRMPRPPISCWTIPPCRHSTRLSQHPAPRVGWRCCRPTAQPWGNVVARSRLGCSNQTTGMIMTEAQWGDQSKSPAIEWHMSAALENVPRGDGDLPEVTSLERAVIAWTELDPQHRADATLTPERAVLLDGVSHTHFQGDGIAALAEHLPANNDRSA